MLKNVRNIITISFSLSQFQALKKETNKYQKISTMWKGYAAIIPGKIFGHVRKQSQVKVVFLRETLDTRLCL